MSYHCIIDTLYSTTSKPPATSTSTAKLVRWVLAHFTVVYFPVMDFSVVVTPEITQLPLPMLKRIVSYQTKPHTYIILILTI